MPHILDAVKQAKADEATRQAFNVLEQLREINNAARKVMTDAASNGKGGMVLFAIDRIQAQVELQAKLLGMFSDTSVNVSMAQNVTFYVPEPEKPPEDA